ncbi:MAG: tmtc3 [Proteobacteria bacterium]|nr:tmtc3 [Pseudomonadota bacterium]
MKKSMPQMLSSADKLYNQGEIESALEKYQTVLAQGKPDAGLYQKIAHCNKILGEFEEARDYYEKSLELDADNLETRFNYAESLAELGEHDEAIEAFDQVIKRAAVTGGDIGAIAEARKKKSNSVLLNRAGGALLKQGDLDGAYEIFIKAVDLDPGDRRNYLNIGVIFINRGDLSAAIEWMGKALEVDPGYIRGYYNLGTLHLKAGYFRRAIDIFNHALHIEPGHPDCDDIVTNLNNAQDQLESAEAELLSRLRGDQPNVDLDELRNLANAVFAEQIEAVDVAITQTGNTRMIAHAANGHYEALLDEGELVTRKMPG